MRQRFAILTAVALLAGSAAAAQAQAVFGVIGGVSRATFTGGGSQGITWRTAFLAGAVGVIPLGETFSIRSELHFATKGARARLGRTADNALELAYLELPLLVQVGTGRGGRLSPYLYGGMSVAMLLRCKHEEVICDADDFDSSLVVGGEVEVRGTALGVRFEAGLSTVKADLEGLEIANGVLSVTLRYLARR